MTKIRKAPAFDVSRFNHIADRHDIPWIDRIPLIETICWQSRGWIDSDLKQRIGGEYKSFMRALERERKNPRQSVRGAMVGVKA